MYLDVCHGRNLHVVNQFPGLRMFQADETILMLRYIANNDTIHEMWRRGLWGYPNYEPEEPSN